MPKTKLLGLHSLLTLGLSAALFFISERRKESATVDAIRELMMGDKVFYNRAALQPEIMRLYREMLLGLRDQSRKAVILSLWKSLVVLAILLGGCAAQQERVERERKTVVEFNESQVIVMTGDLNQSYKILGQINYTDLVSGETIDTNHINARLRRMAIDRYQDQVDAIIRVASTTNSSGGFVVSAEAVEIKGPCSFCRHKELVEVANDETTNRSIAVPSGDLTGVWIGNFTVGCVPPLASATCLRREDISFTFVQHNSTVTGFYECSFSDHPCISQQHGGRVMRIDRTPHMPLIKVRMDDGGNCTFGVTAHKDNEMSGGCICFEVWGQARKGWWHVKRSY